MSMELKDHVKGKVVFVYYKDKNLWYLTETGLKFPVPIDDVQNATFLAVDKGLLFMRWIRKFLEDTAEAKENPFPRSSND